MIDPGGDVDHILSVIDELGWPVRQVLLTHGHLDHVGGAASLAARLGVLVAGPHQADDYWLKGLPQQSQMFGFPPAEVLVPDRWLKAGDCLRWKRVRAGGAALSGAYAGTCGVR